MSSIQELRSQGMSRERVAERLGITPAKVRYHDDPTFADDHKRMAREMGKLLRGFYQWAKKNHPEVLEEFIDKL